MEGKTSSDSVVLSGIPQGTILGPLLFNIYINDVCDTIEHSNIELYADDAKLYGKANGTEGYENIKKDLLELDNYFNEWQLKVNHNKCEVLHMGNGNLKTTYTMSENVLPSKTSCRDLGIHI